MAVAPWEDGVGSEVLYSLNLKSPRDLDLVLMANQIDREDICRVTTRAQAKENSQLEEEEAKEVAQENPSITPLLDQADPVDESSTTPTVDSSVEGKAGVTDSNVQAHNTGNG